MPILLEVFSSSQTTDVNKQHASNRGDFLDIQLKSD